MSAGSSVTGRRGDSGFTMVELMIVMVVMAITAALVIPSIGSGMRQSQVRRSIRQIVSAARRTSAAAIAERRRATLEIWPDDARIVFPDRDIDFELPEFAEFGDIGGARDGSDGEVLVDFFANGSSDGVEFEVIYELRGGEQVYIFRIDPLLSTVRMEAAD